MPLLVLICCISIPLNYFFEKYVVLGSGITGAYKVNRIIKETHSNEIPIFGSSRAEGMFIPDSLGSNFYNYGIAGVQESTYFLMMEEECKKVKKYPLIIANIDLDGLIFSFGIPYVLLYNADYEPVRKAMGTNFKYYHTIPALKYYGMYETYMRYYFNAKTNYTKYVNKGAYIDKTVLTPTAFQSLVAAEKHKKKVFNNDKSMVDRLYSMINKHPNRFFVFVITPYHKAAFESFQNLEVINAFFNDLSKLPNVKVYDFSHVDYPDSLFVNMNHLNYKGALQFSKSFRDSLLSLSNNELHLPPSVF